MECFPSTAFLMIPAWISDGREGKRSRAMSLVMKAWSQPIRPISKGGHVEKGGHVVRRTQKVGTSFGTLKRWARRPNVGTSFSLQKGGHVATDCGDVPTFCSFFLAQASQTDARRGRAPPLEGCSAGGGRAPPLGGGRAPPLEGCRAAVV